jgi:mRNA interferase MazF
MSDEFNKWNELKKDVDASLPDPLHFPKESDVWITILGKNIGFEQNGVGSDFLRPVLVIKRFNNQMFWCIPLSTKQKDYDFYYNLSDPSGMPISVVLAQLRLISIKRFRRKLYSFPEETLAIIKKKLKRFLS